MRSVSGAVGFRRPSLRPTRVVVVAVLAAVALVAAPLAASAHTPIQDGQPHDDAGTALVVTDPDLSQVAYQDMAGHPSFWLAVDLRAGQFLYAQLGTPDIARLADYHPRLALVGPGLGAADVPFDVPAGAGVRLLEPTGPPTRFNEEFTGTRDLIWVTSLLPAPATGRYYLVAYGPPEVPGKVFVTVGLRRAVRPERPAHLPRHAPRGPCLPRGVRGAAPAAARVPGPGVADPALVQPRLPAADARDVARVLTRPD